MTTALALYFRLPSLSWWAAGAAGFSVYPAGLSDPSFKRKLEHLRRDRLNFYSGD